jgi:hypothetical protein
MVAQRYVCERRRNTRNEIAHDAKISDSETVGFHPLLDLMLGAVMRKVAK